VGERLWILIYDVKIMLLLQMLKYVKKNCN